MSNVTQQTATRLKQAGLPQPTPQTGQFWWTSFDGISYINKTIESRNKLQFCGEYVEQIYKDLFAQEHFIFAPSIDYITSFLPEGFILQMWDGRHSCKVETEETTVRTQAESFVEAAALAYLSLHETI